ncbi:7-cyano-7-deazaguanine synthase [Streptomyces sp. 8L]|uniref:7-cyano-7-deazaguanine synthase n=1 Tax=Streptomyces sp. 8L TaxID=2877242 RepID=UPI001CD35EDC|nr:7-cyano-7-deazaguanine synthase [Streptomyces sp. 8L]MCA1220379.1 7-cyano-7-deazaguanine synthase [Streptomyces sp. 8L]
MTAAYRRFFWRESDEAEPPTGWQPLGDGNYWESEHRAPQRLALLAPPPPWADDLQRIGRAVFAADKHARRDATFDRWTRHIRLSVPVAAHERWQAARPLLSSLLQTLTGDHWQVEFRGSRPATDVSLTFDTASRAGEVALFSGGLDSLSWAAQRATAHTSESLLLVTFGEQNFPRLQGSVYASIYRRRNRPVRRIILSQNVRFQGKKQGDFERTTRSRGFLYAVGAVRAAAAEGTPVAHIPENGQLSINPPLSPARAAACSTRSVHPWTLHLLNRLIAAVADGPVVELQNPLARLTKRQVCHAALDAGLTPANLAATLSCGVPPPQRTHGSRYDNCGLCYPCLVRRAGLLGVDDM